MNKQYKPLHMAAYHMALYQQAKEDFKQNETTDIDYAQKCQAKAYAQMRLYRACIDMMSTYEGKDFHDVYMDAHHYLKATGRTAIINMGEKTEVGLMQ